jgi:glycosyltransferase EpsD
MRKLLVTASVYSHIYRFHQPYLRAFHEAGWEIHAACAGLRDGAEYIDRPIEIPFEKKMWSASNYRAFKMLRELIRAEDYDLIITHTSLAAFFTRLALKGNMARPPLL